MVLGNKDVDPGNSKQPNLYLISSKKIKSQLRIMKMKFWMDVHRILEVRKNKMLNMYKKKTSVFILVNLKY